MKFHSISALFAAPAARLLPSYARNSRQESVNQVPLTTHGKQHGQKYLKTRILITALAGFLLSMPSQAALLDQGNVTQDTISGLTWLDATATVGMSYNQVTLQLGPGGAFEGYRYATLSELEGFLTAAGGTGPFLTSIHLPVNDWVTTLRGLWGSTYAVDPTGNIFTWVLWGESAISTVTEYVFNPVTFNLDEIQVTAARVETGLLQDYYAGNFATARFGVGEHNLETVDYTSPYLGSALVQGVPEPSSAVLLLGSAALLALRRRRASAR